MSIYLGVFLCGELGTTFSRATTGRRCLKKSSMYLHDTTLPLETVEAGTGVVHCTAYTVRGDRRGDFELRNVQSGACSVEA